MLISNLTRLPRHTSGHLLSALTVQRFPYLERTPGRHPFPFSAKMQNEATRLTRDLSPDRPSRSILRTDWAVLTFDHVAAALCIFLKFISYYVNYLTLSRDQSPCFYAFHVMLSEIATRAVLFLWCEITLSYEAAILKRVSEINSSEASDEAKKTARKANRKATAVPDIFQISLELTDQLSANTTPFSKAGYRTSLAFGASAAIVCLPFILQLRSKSLISKVSADRRRKEQEM